MVGLLCYNRATMNKRGLLFFISTLVISALAVASAYYFIFSRNTTTWKKIAPPIISQENLPVSALDGLPVSSTDQMTPQVLGVMIDNHPDARPQSGLTAAKIVYEAPAEGPITRYFALFDSSQTVLKIGPVRSARPYFVDWLEEYSGMYMHCGGSPDGLGKIKLDQVFDMDEMKNGQYFWRDDSRVAPHNLYTKSDLWNKALDKNISKQNRFVAGWKFGEVAANGVSALQGVTITYFSDYVVMWKYDSTSKKYTRYINDVLGVSDDSNIETDNIVIQYVKSQITDDYGRRAITTVGTGSMRLLRDGVSVIGSWRNENNRTRFYNANGQELNLKPGKIWVQVVPEDVKIKIST